MAESFRPISLNECPQWYRESSDALSNGNNHVKITVINTTVYMTPTLLANYSNFLSGCGRGKFMGPVYALYMVSYVIFFHVK